MGQKILYYGDNLQILRNPHYFPDESVDLIYLDPPFKSNQDYNVLFAEQDGSRSAAQIKAFEEIPSNGIKLQLTPTMKSWKWVQNRYREPCKHFVIFFMIATC
jgi:site-specific DNA-methyltransferase (adenine-specific)